MVCMSVILSVFCKCICVSTSGCVNIEMNDVQVYEVCVPVNMLIGIHAQLCVLECLYANTSSH